MFLGIWFKKQVHKLAKTFIFGIFHHISATTIHKASENMHEIQGCDKCECEELDLKRRTVMVLPFLPHFCLEKTPFRLNFVNT